MSDAEKYVSPVPQKEITVNINDWLNQTQRPVQQLQQYTTVEEVRAEAESHAQLWLAQQKERQLAPLLEDKAIECSECSELRRPYKDDYICHECRDQLETE